MLFYYKGRGFAMSFMSKFFSFLGFESEEKEKKVRQKKEKRKSGSYNFKKKQKVEKPDNIDGVSVVYPEDFSDAERILEYLRNDEAVIISIDYLLKDDVEKVVAYLDGASKMVGGSIKLLEKDKYYVFLPEGVEIEE